MSLAMLRWQTRWMKECMKWGTEKKDHQHFPPNCLQHSPCPSSLCQLSHPEKWKALLWLLLLMKWNCWCQEEGVCAQLHMHQFAFWEVSKLQVVADTEKAFWWCMQSALWWSGDAKPRGSPQATTQRWELMWTEQSDADICEVHQPDIHWQWWLALRRHRWGWGRIHIERGIHNQVNESKENKQNISHSQSPVQWSPKTTQIESTPTSSVLSCFLLMSAFSWWVSGVRLFFLSQQLFPFKEPNRGRLSSNQDGRRLLADSCEIGPWNSTSFVANKMDQRNLSPDLIWRHTNRVQARKEWSGTKACWWHWALCKCIC